MLVTRPGSASEFWVITDLTSGRKFLQLGRSGFTRLKILLIVKQNQALNLLWCCLTESNYWVPHSIFACVRSNLKICGRIRPNHPLAAYYAERFGLNAKLGHYTESFRLSTRYRILGGNVLPNNCYTAKIRSKTSPSVTVIIQNAIRISFTAH